MPRLHNNVNSVSSLTPWDAREMYMVKGLIFDIFSILNFDLFTICRRAAGLSRLGSPAMVSDHDK